MWNKCKREIAELRAQVKDLYLMIYGCKSYPSLYPSLSKRFDRIQTCFEYHAEKCDRIERRIDRLLDHLGVEETEVPFQTIITKVRDESS